MIANTSASVLDQFRPQFHEHLGNLRHWVGTEGRQAFRKIIDANGDLSIYSLGLYYSAGGWEYLLPTYASEEGLAHTVRERLRHSPASEETLKISLRWSPCDSPHHAEEELESMMPQTQSALDEIHRFLALLDPDHSMQLWPEGSDFEDYMQLLEKAHEDTRAAVIHGLNDVLEDRALNNFFDSRQCALTLNAGDLSDSDFLKNIKPLNSPETFSRVAIEIVEAVEAHTIVEALWSVKQRREARIPPSTDLDLEDFRDVIDGFCPAFMVQGDAIFLHSLGDTPAFQDSFSEEHENRIKLMQLLESSPHFEEIDRLYGHFRGNQFVAEDLLPSIARELTFKLGKALASRFKDRTFRVLMVVDRHSLYYITFHCKRDDGHVFNALECQIDGGVYEIYEFNGDKVYQVHPSQATHHQPGNQKDPELPADKPRSNRRRLPAGALE